MGEGNEAPWTEDTPPAPTDPYGISKLEAEVAAEKDLSADTLQRLVAKIEEFSENNRAHGLPAELTKILQDDLRAFMATTSAK